MKVLAPTLLEVSPRLAPTKCRHWLNQVRYVSVGATSRNVENRLACVPIEGNPVAWHLRKRLERRLYATSFEPGAQILPQFCVEGERTYREVCRCVARSDHEQALSLSHRSHPHLVSGIVIDRAPIVAPMPHLDGGGMSERNLLAHRGQLASERIDTTLPTGPDPRAHLPYFGVQSRLLQVAGKLRHTLMRRVGHRSRNLVLLHRRGQSHREENDRLPLRPSLAHGVGGYNRSVGRRCGVRPSTLGAYPVVLGGEAQGSRRRGRRRSE